MSERAAGSAGRETEWARCAARRGDGIEDGFFCSGLSSAGTRLAGWPGRSPAMVKRENVRQPGGGRRRFRTSSPRPMERGAAQARRPRRHRPRSRAVYVGFHNAAEWRQRALQTQCQAACSARLACAQQSGFSLSRTIACASRKISRFGHRRQQNLRRARRPSDAEPRPTHISWRSSAPASMTTPNASAAHMAAAKLRADVNTFLLLLMNFAFT